MYVWKIIYEKYQNQNTYTSAYGKWYARVKYIETLNTRKMAQHISEHDGLGTFYCTLKNRMKKSGAATKEKYDIKEYVCGLRSRLS